MREPALIVVNSAAGYGHAPARLARVYPALERSFELTPIQGSDWLAELRAALRSGTPRLVIAAGGDGTVSAVARELLEVGADRFLLGAIGLGSSNDFHKGRSCLLEGVPARIDPDNAVTTDVVRVDCTTPAGPERRCFVVSASCGATAEANALFNSPSGSLAFWRRRISDVAVLQAAAASIGRHRPVWVKLSIDGSTGREWSVSNLSLLKTPWLGGTLRYDTPVAPDSGRMAVNMCHDMTRPELVGLLWGLRSGRFRGRSKTWHRMARRVELTTSRPVALELDGELIEVTRASFVVVRGGLKVCG